MIIRQASFRDLGRVEELYRDVMASGSDGASQLHTDRPVPQGTTLVRLWYAVSKTLSSLMPISDGNDPLLVAEHPQEGIVGFIQAQPAPGKLRAWQIVNLGATATPVGQRAAEQLITGLCEHGQENDVSRFFVRLPLDHPLFALFIEQGFTQYATEQILFADSVGPDTEPRAVVLRSARRDDLLSLHLLYLRVTPATVAATESPNRKSWESTFAGGIAARIGRDDVRHLVAENPGVYGWAAVRPATGTRPTTLHLLCDAQNPADRDAFVDAVVGELPEGPVTCVLRHYDSELIRSLQARGFVVYGTQVLLAHDLAVRVRLRSPALSARKKPVLVPAGLVRNVPTVAAPRSPLHVLRTTVNGVPRSET